MLKYFFASLFFILTCATALPQLQPPPGICSGKPPAGNAVSNRLIACATDSVRLTVANDPDLENLTYQWQVSVDSSTWTDIPNATNISCVTIQDSTRFYRRLTSCSGNTAISTPIKVGKGPCYCRPAASNCGYGNNLRYVSIGKYQVYSDCSPNGYVDYSDSLQPLEILPPNLSIYVSLGLGNGSAEFMNCWIDLNRNGVFEPTEYYYLGGTFSTTTGGYYYTGKNITIPFDNPGLTKVRIRVSTNRELSAYDACTAIAEGETEDYLLNILPYNYCSGTPLQDTAYGNVAHTCSYNDSVYLHTTRENSKYHNYTYQWQKSTDSITWKNLYATGADAGDFPSVTTYYRRRISCGDSSNYSVPAKISMLCYCIPDNSICSTGVAINKVVLNGVEYPSGCGYRGYQDLSRGTSYSHVDTILAGTPLPISVQVGCGNAGTQYVGVWMDLNVNGAFEPSEYTYLGTACNSTLNGLINIPATASGQPKIRVRVTTDAAMSAESSCSVFAYGETEDYRINILPAPNTCGTNTWTGNGADNLWENAANWSCNRVPGPTDTVAINSGSVTINSNVTVYALALSAAATLTVVPPNNLVILH